MKRAVASSVTLQLHLRNDFYHIFEVQHELNIVSGPAPAPGCAPATNYCSGADNNATVTCHYAVQSVQRPAFDSWLLQRCVQTGPRAHTICSPIGSEGSFPGARKSLTSIYCMDKNTPAPTVVNGVMGGGGQNRPWVLERSHSERGGRLV